MKSRCDCTFPAPIPPPLPLSLPSTLWNRPLHFSKRLFPKMGCLLNFTNHFLLPCQKTIPFRVSFVWRGVPPKAPAPQRDIIALFSRLPRQGLSAKVALTQNQGTSVPTALCQTSDLLPQISIVSMESAQFSVSNVDCGCASAHLSIAFETGLSRASSKSNGEAFFRSEKVSPSHWKPDRRTCKS
jgi:hypothetical protein